MFHRWNEGVTLIAGISTGYDKHAKSEVSSSTFWHRLSGKKEQIPISPIPLQLCCVPWEGQACKAELARAGLPFWSHLVLGTFWKWLLNTQQQQQGGYPLVAEMMMIKRMTATTTPMIPIIFMFCHQYFLLRRVAWRKMSKLLGSFGPVYRQTWVWNWFAPSWRLSALWSSSESLLSLSSTFSTLTRMMSTTSPTCACACASREFPCSGVAAILSLSDLSEMVCQVWQKPRGSESFCEQCSLNIPCSHFTRCTMTTAALIQSRKF